MVHKETNYDTIQTKYRSKDMLKDEQKKRSYKDFFFGLIQKPFENSTIVMLLKKSLIKQKYRCQVLGHCKFAIIQFDDLN